MSKIKTLFLAVATALSFMIVPALAQFSPTPSNPSTKSTYRATITGLATAASATDFFTLTGSATKVVSVQRAVCSGIATTAGSASVVAIRRSAANTGGTSTTPAVASNDPSNAAATAVARAYTANPSAVGATAGAVASGKINLPLAATGSSNTVAFEFADIPYSQPIVLRGATQVFALNGNGATLAAGASLDCFVEWTEQ